MEASLNGPRSQLEGYERIPVKWLWSETSPVKWLWSEKSPVKWLYGMVLETTMVEQDIILSEVQTESQWDSSVI